MSTALEDAEALESDANAKEAALEATEPFQDLEATASRAEAILPTEATMSSALEDAEALESDANARQEAGHPTNLPESFQAEQHLGSHHQDEGTTQALGDTKGIERELEASSTSEESSQGAGEDSESDDSSTSDSSDGDEGQLAGLAASMWSALQKQRQGQNSGLLEKESGRPSQERGLSGKHLPGEGDISWQPKTLLPKQLQSKELIARPALEVQKAADHKQLMAAPRDKKAEAKTKAQAKPSDWHELPTTEITDELKRDLRLIRLRGAMDPKRFYKRAEKGKFAAKFAVGTVIEGPAEFFSSRLTNKERKQTITEELLADRDLQNSRKRRFSTLQEEQSRWSHKKHKGSGERIKKKSKSAKH